MPDQNRGNKIICIVVALLTFGLIFGTMIFFYYYYKS